MSGRLNLRVRPHGPANSLWNEDLAATPLGERTWGVSNYVSLWFAMAGCIPAYMLASGLIAIGMSWKEALGTILLGSLIVLVPIILNAHAGAKYGIPFPAYVRASFGLLGANIPLILRALVACGWFGIQCWIGGEALFAAMKIFLPGLGQNAAWWCFAAFWLLNMALSGRGMETIRSLQLVSAALLLILGLALLLWTVGSAGGFIAMLAHSGTMHRSDASAEARPVFWKIFVPALTGVVGFWSAVALSIPDVTRYAKSPKTQMVGQAIGMPAAMTLYSLIAIMVTLATVIVTPDHLPIWNPIALVASFPQPVVAVLGLVAILLATLATNLANNLVVPSHDFAGLLPGIVSFRMGGLIGALLGIAFTPWNLVSDPERYINGWLVGASGFLGPIAGIMIADYCVLRRQSLNVDELYLRGGAYEYHRGLNRRALLALASGVAVALVGVFVPTLHWLYQGSWFIGFAVAAILYLLLMSGPDVTAMIPPNPLLIPVDGFEPESPMA